MLIKSFNYFLLSVLALTSCGKNPDPLREKPINTYPTMPKKRHTIDKYGHNVPLSHRSSSQTSIHSKAKLESGNKSTNWLDYLPPAYDQGQCGTCYAFAATQYFSALLNK